MLLQPDASPQRLRLRRRRWLTLLLSWAAAASGCTSFDDSAPPPVQLVQPDDLVDLRDVAPGAECAGGGVRVVSGVDDDGDGALSDAEVDDERLLCNGANGADGDDGNDGTNGSDGNDGSDGAQSLVDVVDEPPGANCADGGQRIDTGVDADGDGLLDAEEVAASDFVCVVIGPRNAVVRFATIAGASGVAPCFEAGGQLVEAGLDDNANGVLDDGEAEVTTTVCNGAAGARAAVDTVVVPPDSSTECGAAGGFDVRAGLDTDGDGGVDVVESTRRVCHGAAGADGADGTDGTNGTNGADGTDGTDGADGLRSLVSITDLLVGSAACPTGGRRIVSGLDDDADGALDEPAEVDDDDAICNGALSLIEVTVEPPGVACPAGGFRIASGVDFDASGALDPAVENVVVNVVCHGVTGASGAAGADGVDGLTPVVETADLAADPGLCPAGGTRIRVGFDLDDNGVLEGAAEINDERFVCNGTNGINGVDGVDGVDGTNGVDGFTTLVDVAVEAPGPSCPAGGRRIRAGLDVDRDGLLDDPAEIVTDAFVCNGVDGVDGADGTNGTNGTNGTDGADGADGFTSLVEVTAEPAGAACPTAGQRIVSGLDDGGGGGIARDGALQAGEVDATEFVCNGAQGPAGFDSLIAQTTEPPGAACPFGGVRFDSGLDADRDGTLAAAEVSATTRACNGADGFNTLLRFTAEPPGCNCLAGGQRLEAGLDDGGGGGVARNGVLEAGEVDASAFVCDGEDAITTQVVKRLALGFRHACAVLIDDTFKCWGRNDSGQLGLGDTASRGDAPNETGTSLPIVDVGTGRSVVAPAAGDAHTCAMLDNNAVKCWGTNGAGQLGLGDSTARGDNAGEMGDALPTVNLGTGRFAQKLALGQNHTCAILDDGTLKCWGSNGVGQLGLGDTAARGDQAGEMGDALAAVDLGTGRRAVEVAAANEHTCAVLDDGAVKCWGQNNFGQLGQGDTVRRGDNAGEMGDALLPIDLGAGFVAVAVAAGVAHTCAVSAAGTVKCWGAGASGRLGYGDLVTRGDNAGEMGDALPTVDIGTGQTATTVDIGASSCVRLASGEAKCWGNNNVGQLGLGNVADRGDNAGEMGDALPPLDLAGRLVDELHVGVDFACAELDDAQVKCWGGNTFGQLGQGDTAARGNQANEMGDFLNAIDLGVRPESVCP